MPAENRPETPVQRVVLCMARVRNRLAGIFDPKPIEPVGGGIPVHIVSFGNAGAAPTVGLAVTLPNVTVAALPNVTVASLPNLLARENATRKVLGQVLGQATTETDLYTVPGSTTAKVTSLKVTNRSGAGVTYRVSVSVGGGATANKDYLAYDRALAANETVELLAGEMYLGAGDKVRVYASTGDLSFVAFGVEYA